MNNKIDIVITWVDGSDEKWIKSFNEHVVNTDNNYINKEMYRDYGLLRYWFRGIEKFAPWVNKIHFVTCGHIPEWLDRDNSKLNIVKHEDYINKELLPVFSARPIEINMHKIDGLSEHFVFFNDDMFLIDHITPEFFFKNNLPCDALVMKYISGNKGIDHTILNDLGSINSKLNKGKFIKKNINKWFNFNYPFKDIIKNILLLNGRNFSGFTNYHMPQAYTKSLFLDVWDNFEGILNKTNSTKFRSLNNVNQYLFRYWSLINGKFSPVNMNKDRTYFGLTDDNKEIVEYIKKQKTKIICINDEKVEDFDSIKIQLTEAFQSILTIKSSFEV